MNTIINFGDYLEEDVLGSAKRHAKRADLVLALGTTLQVSPANSLVEMGQKPTRLVICNRYKSFSYICMFKFEEQTIFATVVVLVMKYRIYF